MESRKCGNLAIGWQVHYVTKTVITTHYPNCHSSAWSIPLWTEHDVDQFDHDWGVWYPFAPRVQDMESWLELNIMGLNPWFWGTCGIIDALRWQNFWPLVMISFNTNNWFGISNRLLRKWGMIFPILLLRLNVVPSGNSMYNHWLLLQDNLDRDYPAEYDCLQGGCGLLKPDRTLT